MKRKGPTWHEAAAAYRTSRQNIWTLRKSGVVGWGDPDKIFEQLLTRPASPLRLRLSDPENREAIRKALSEKPKERPDCSAFCRALTQGLREAK